MLCVEKNYLLLLRIGQMVVMSLNEQIYRQQTKEKKYKI